MDDQAGPSAKRFRKNHAQDAALVKIIYISELKRNGSSQYFSQGGANVDKIYEIFQKFGSIESVQAKRWKYRFYGAIEFNDAKVVAELLTKRLLRINGSTFHVSSIDKPYQPTDVDSAEFAKWLQQPSVPSPDSPKNILNALNDDCLREIFQRIDHLADFDSIANVCVRFNQIALLVFPPKIRSRCINIDDFAFDNGFNADRIKLSQLKNFLSTFGSSIASLEFRRMYLEQTPHAANLAIKMIDKYCKNVRHLNIEISEQQHEIADEIRSIFSKLHELQIRFVRITRLNPKIYDFISVCSDLFELNIHGSLDSFRMTDTVFAYLTKFTFGINASSTNYKLLDQIIVFLEKNRQIEEIELHEKWVNYKVMETLANMSNLRKIKFPIFRNNLEGLSRLSHAKIDLGETWSDERIEQIFHLPNLTKITFYSKEERILSAAQKLHNLNEMTILLSEPMSFETIKEVVRDARNLEKLNIRKKYSAESDSDRFDENSYKELLEVVLARKENHKKFTIIYEFGLNSGDRSSNVYKKFIAFDEHPSLSVFKYYTNKRRDY